MAEEKCFGHSCVDCGTMGCVFEQNFPKFCLSKKLDEDPVVRKAMDKALELYEDPLNLKVMQESAQVEFQNYCQFTRIQEIIDFARRMGYKKIGIATCIGLIKEAGMAAKIFRQAGFDVYGQSCKAGMQPKLNFGIGKECEAVGKYVCNPIFQAQHFNAIGTELNVIVGLCVGHDSLFYKYSDALVTTLITKDRVLGHNPAAALYTEYSYYGRKLNMPPTEE